MLELQAIMDAGYQDRNEITKMMRLKSPKVLGIYLQRLDDFKERNAEQQGTPRVDDRGTPTDVKSFAKEGPGISEDTLGEPTWRKGEQHALSNRALWGNGVGSASPASTIRSGRQYFDKALLEPDGFEVMVVKRLVCDALDTPSTEFGNVISNRTADLALKELRRRRVDRLVDEHQCYLIVRQALRALVRETPFAKRYVNKRRLSLATKRSGNKITPATVGNATEPLSRGERE